MTSQILNQQSEWMSFRCSFSSIIVFCLLLTSMNVYSQQNTNITIDANSPYIINHQSVGHQLSGGDTIFILSERVQPLKFKFLEGNAANPIVIINKGGQVKIDGISFNSWGAITFENCKHIKISGSGHPGYKYGFELSALESGLTFSELSSDCEAENIKISHDGFFGVYAKKDYNGNPPSPVPTFENLIIHDCFIEGVSEGLYIGETKTPGMEFKHVKIYNNVIRNTHRESIQIANCVEDVEIFNNTLLNAGLEGLNAHKNILQIGDNSIASIYQNILIGAPDYGIIVFGKGDIEMTNNYFENNKGIFLDNRIVSDTALSIEASANYFKTSIGQEIIRNMNEKNSFSAIDNLFDTNIPFYNDLNNIDNEFFQNNNYAQVSSLNFTDTASNDYSLASPIPVEYIGIGAPGGPEFFDFEDPATTPNKIIITPEMVTDNVIGGSINSPLFLFDEQNVNIDNDEHPISVSWKPFYNMAKESYHSTVDLGGEYFISQINLHDMHDTHDFVVEYYDGNDWIALVQDSLDNFKQWIRNDVEISTRYLRFSMYDSPYAAVNEIIVYGYPLIKESKQIIVDSSMVNDLVAGGSVYSPNYLFDEQNLSVTSNEKPVSLSWKPFYNENNAPYHAVLDLNNEYKITEIALHDMHNTNDLIVETSEDGENWETLFVEACDAFKVWQIHQVDIITKYLRFTMLESPYASVNEILLFGSSIMTLPEENFDLENQITISPEMITDLVPGGSVDTPLYLFDEQEVNPELYEKPISKNWKPFYNTANSPYYATVDFGQEYHITKIYIHDMHSTHDFNIEYEESFTWSHLLTEPCNAYNVWKEHEVDISTSKLRLSMLNSPYAGVNEIIFIGYPISNKRNKNGDFNDNSLASSSSDDSLKPTLFPNPVKDHLNLKLPEYSEVGNQNIKIFDMSGKLLQDMDIKNDSFNTTVRVNMNTVVSKSGLYFLMYKNDKGVQETFKVSKI